MEYKKKGKKELREFAKNILFFYIHLCLTCTANKISNNFYELFYTFV